MRGWAVLAVLSLAAVPAAAAPITYTFSGTVNQVGTRTLVPVAVGQGVPIVITLDGAFPQTSPGSGTYAFNGGNPAVGFVGAVIAATLNGENLYNFIQTITVSPSDLSILTTGPQTGFGLQLDVRGTFASVAGALPASIDPASVTGGTFSVTEAFSPQIIGYSGTIIGAQPVPEPASLTLLGAGVLGGLAWKARRRSRTPSPGA